MGIGFGVRLSAIGYFKLLLFDHADQQIRNNDISQSIYFCASKGLECIPVSHETYSHGDLFERY